MRFAISSAGTDYEVLQLVVLSIYKMPYSHLSVSSLHLFLKFIGKPPVMWKPEEICHRHFHKHILLLNTEVKTRRTSLINMALSQIGIRKLVVFNCCCSLDIETKPRGKTIAPVVWMLYPRVKVCLFYHSGESQNRDSINFQLCHGTA